MLRRPERCCVCGRVLLVSKMCAMSSSYELCMLVHGAAGGLCGGHVGTGNVGRLHC